MKHTVSMIFRETLFLSLLAIGTPNVFAQTMFGPDMTWTGKETKEEKWQKMIDIDMSVPNFKTKKINQEMMGWRLAKIIEVIQKSYLQGYYNRTLSFIRYEQTEDPRIRFEGIEKLTFVEAEKIDSVILIKWHTFSKLENKEKVNHYITMRFVNGLSESEAVNELFSDIARYIKPDEE